MKRALIIVISILTTLTINNSVEAMCLAVPCKIAEATFRTISINKNSTSLFSPNLRLSEASTLILSVTGELDNVYYVDCNTDSYIKRKQVKDKFPGYKQFNHMPETFVLTKSEAKALKVFKNKKFVPEALYNIKLKVKIKEDCCDTPNTPCLKKPYMVLAK